MSLIISKVSRPVGKLLTFEQKRFGSKINIQKPRKPFFLRGVFNEFATPFYPAAREAKPLWELCDNVVNPKQKKTDQEPHPYQVIIARECLDWYKKSRMIAFLHKNSIKSEDQMDFQILIHKDNMSLRYWGAQTAAVALKGTPYEAVLPLFCAPGLIVFSPEPNVAKLQKHLKTAPQLILMAGILDGTLLNVNDFLKYGKMDITSARCGLVQTLQSAAGGNVCRQLTHHQETLVTRLGQIGKEETKDPLQDIVEA